MVKIDLGELMLINNLQQDIEEVYNDSNFIIFLESHLTYLKNTSSIASVTVTEHQGYKYEGDFYGLLNDLRIDKQYHYIVLRVNGLESSCDFKGDSTQILMPNLDEINLLKEIYQTKGS